MRFETRKPRFLTCLILTFILLLSTSASICADTTPTSPEQIADRYKLKMIQVLGKDLPGFNKNILNYTYYMTPEEKIQINGNYRDAITVQRVNEDSDLLISTSGNIVILMVHKNMDPNFVTYTVTFEKKLSSAPADKVAVENKILSELLTSKLEGPELTEKTNAALNNIISDVKQAKTSEDASSTFHSLQNTLSAVAPLIEKADSKDSIIDKTTELTNASRGLVIQIEDHQTLTESAQGYFQEMSGVLKQTESGSTTEVQLKNRIKDLGTEAAYKVGEYRLSNAQLNVSGPIAQLNVDSAAVISHIDTANGYYRQLSQSSSNLLGSDNPRKLDFAISLQAEKPESVSELKAQIDKPLLDAASSKGIEKFQLKLDKTQLAFSSSVLEEGENQLLMRASFSDIPQQGLPAGTAPIQNSFVSDVTLSSNGEEKSTLQLPAQLTLDLKDAQLSNYTEFDQKKIGIYILDESTGSWMPVGGNYDPITQKIKVYRLHLSKYTVLKTDKSFSDVENSWAKDDINELLGKGVIQDAALFSPTEYLTREDFTQWIANAYGLENKGVKLPFTDVASDHPYYNQMAAAYSQGIIKGKSSTTFDPKGKITRQEMATLISNALIKYNKASLNSSLVAKLNKYSDNQQIASWAQNYVALVNEMGIMQGDSRGFRPNDYITKEEAAKVLKRIYN